MGATKKKPEIVTVTSIELRNVRVDQRMSEETTAFSAAVYINGKRHGEAYNHGHGGENVLRLAEPAGYYTPVREFMEAHLPEDLKQYAATSGVVDLFVGHLLDQHLTAKEEKKLSRIDAKEYQRFLAMGRPVTVRVTFEKCTLWVGFETLISMAEYLKKPHPMHGAIKSHKVFVGAITAPAPEGT